MISCFRIKRKMLGSLFFASLTASALALCPSTIGPGEHLQTVVVGGVERTFYVRILIFFPCHHQQLYPLSLFYSSFPFISLSSLQFVTIYEHVFLVFVPLSMYGLLPIFGGYVSLMFKRLTHQSSVITDPSTLETILVLFLGLCTKRSWRACLSWSCDAPRMRLKP